MVSDSELTHMDRWNRDLFILQDLCDLIRTKSFQSHLKDPSDDLRSFLIHNPLVRIVLTLEVTIWRIACYVLAGSALCLKDGLDLLTGVLGVPFIHDVSERHKVIVAFGSIYAVIDGDEHHTLLTEHFHKLTDLQVVTAHTAHVLNADLRDVALLDLLHHGKKARAVEASAGDPVVGEMAVVGYAMVSGIFFEHFFLVRDTVGLTELFIIMTQTLIQSHVFLLMFHRFLLPSA